MNRLYELAAIILLVMCLCVACFNNNTASVASEPAPQSCHDNDNAKKSIPELNDCVRP